MLYLFISKLECYIKLEYYSFSKKKKKVGVLYFYLLLILNVTCGYICWFRIDITYNHLNENQH